MQYVVWYALQKLKKIYGFLSSMKTRGRVHIKDVSEGQVEFLSFSVRAMVQREVTVVTYSATHLASSTART